MSVDTTVRPLILVVEDSRLHRKLAVDLLEDAGLSTAECANGEEALKFVEASPPDLVLLDITMPGLDGIETCRRLKARPATADVPILFFTALDQIVGGLEAGASDYITKPFQPAELLARVRAHLRVKLLQDDLKRANGRMLELERTRQQFAAMMAHDMRGLLTSIVGAVQLLEEVGYTEREPDAADLIEMAGRNADELNRMVTSLLDIYRMQDGKMPFEPTTVDLVRVVSEAIAQASGARAAGKVVLELVADRPVRIEGDRILLGRVIGNLLANAVKFSPPEATVRVVVEPAPDGPGALLAVTDAGPGVPPEEQPYLFDQFYQGAGGNARRKGGSGLGLAFCKQVVARHGGRIWVESAPGAGSTFVLTLPAHPPATPDSYTPADRQPAAPVPTGLV